jgi:hypothetical protein
MKSTALWLLLRNFDNEEAKVVAANGLVDRGKRSFEGCVLERNSSSPRPPTYVDREGTKEYFQESGENQIEILFKK